MNKIKKIIKSNEYLFIFGITLYNLYNQLLLWLSPDDVKFLRRQYKKRTKKSLNLESPSLFNEKIQYLKLYYRPAILKELVDKYEVRKFVEDKGFPQTLIPIFGVYNTYSDIQFSKLPNQFVMKLTNGSGQNKLVFDKKQLKYKRTKWLVNSWQKINHYAIGREWGYKDVRNRIIIEKMLVDSQGNIPKDYKFMCFNGEPKVIGVYSDRFSKKFQRVLFDQEWNPLTNRAIFEQNTETFAQPKSFEQMFTIAKELSQGFPFVRIDMYEFEGKPYFGEMTFYPKGGYMEFEDERINQKLGDYLSLFKDIAI